MMKTIIIISVLIGVSLGLGIHYDIYNDETCAGNNKEQGEYDHVLECLQKCDGMDKCAGVERIEKDRLCIFKKKCDLSKLTPCDGCVLYGVPHFVYEVEAHNDCPGHTIDTVEHRHLLKCVEACDAKPECVGFFRNLEDKCFLKNQCLFKSVADGNLYMNDLAQFQFLPDSDCKAPNLEESKVDSTGQCKRNCMDREGCAAIVYNPSNGNCQLKPDCDDITVTKGLYVFLNPEEGLVGGHGEDCASVDGVCRSPAQCKDDEKKCPQTCGSGKQVCCCKREEDQVTTKDECKAEGGKCRDAGKCRDKEEKCGVCGVGRGKDCCCET